MAKKRKCRYTEEELNIHEKAVKLRKMTDAQLVGAFEEAQNSVAAFKRTQDGESKQHAEDYQSDVEKLLQALSEGKCKGVAGATYYKIMGLAKEMGMIA